MVQSSEMLQQKWYNFPYPPSSPNLVLPAGCGNPCQDGAGSTPKQTPSLSFFCVKLQFGAHLQDAQNSSGPCCFTSVILPTQCQPHSHSFQLFTLKPKIPEEQCFTPGADRKSQLLLIPVCTPGSSTRFSDTTGKFQKHFPSKAAL